MKRSRRWALMAVGAAATVAAVTAGVVLAPMSHADVPGPYFATQNLGSDPHMIPCKDGNTNGFCLYTSRDMGASFRYPGNYYPMEETRAYFSTNGYSGWVDKGRVFHENTLESAGWVPTNAYHLWAPSAVKNGSYYYLFVPDVSDISNDSPPNISTSSRISVSRSTSPFGPFSYRGTVTVQGYMSDPDVVMDGSTPWIIWANGDNGTCGGFTTAPLESDMMTTVSRSVNPVTLHGINVLGDCDGAGPKTGPYVEGASSYKIGSTWVMYFAAKPTSTPAECATSVGGPGTANEVIAWATSNYASGAYTYKGIVMCGSSTEWTNQATVQTLPNARTIMVYHDSAADVKERRLHAECLFFSKSSSGAPTIIAGVYRQALNAANGFNDCMAGTNSDYRGLHMKDPQYPNVPPIIRAPSNGTALTANRSAVGPWERYRRVDLGSGVFALRALSNGKYLCAQNTSTPIAASCTSSGDTNAQWKSQSTSGGLNFKSVAHNKFLSVGGDGRLYASGDVAAHGAVVNYLSMGGFSA